MSESNENDTGAWLWPPRALMFKTMCTNLSQNYLDTISAVLLGFGQSRVLGTKSVCQDGIFCQNGGIIHVLF